MPKTQHTPGPWIVEEYEDGYGVGRVIHSDIDDDDTESLCICLTPIEGTERANARLMAAAPALLLVLEIHHNNCINTQPEYHENGADAIGFRMTKLVIDTAKGVA